MPVPETKPQSRIDIGSRNGGPSQLIDRTPSQTQGTPGNNASKEAVRLYQKTRPGFAIVIQEPDGIRGAALNGQPEPHEFFIPHRSNPRSTVKQLLAELRNVDGTDTDWRGIGAVGFNGQFNELSAESWNKDQVPWIDLQHGDRAKTEEHDPAKYLNVLKTMHSEEGQPQVFLDPEGYVVNSRLGTHKDQLAVLPEQRRPFYEQTQDKIAERLYKNNVVTIAGNTTAVAGGVAQMNAELDRFIKGRNDEVKIRQARGEEAYPIDFRWRVADTRIDKKIAREFGLDLDTKETHDYFMKKYGDTNKETGEKFINIFRLTKDRHNALQGKAQPGYEYTDLDDKYFHAWAKTQWETNFKGDFTKLLEAGKKVVFKIEDQQMFAMMPYMMQDFPKDDYPDLYLNPRFHIYIDGETLAKQPDSPAGKIAQSVINDLQGADAYMVHVSREEQPDQFMFRDAEGNYHPLLRDISVYAPASMDTTTGSRIKMSREKEAKVRRDNESYLFHTGQSTEFFDLEAFGETNRWDRSKEKYVGLKAYAQHVEDQLAEGVPLDQILQYRTVGMAPNDDPESRLIYTAYMLGIHPELRDRPEYADYMKWVDASDPTMLKPKYPEDMHKATEDVTRFQPEEWEVIRMMNEMVLKNPLLKQKIELYRFNYEEHNDLNRNAVESSRVADNHASRFEASEDNITGHISAGRFVFVANAGGAPQQVKEGITGHKFEPGDHQELARGMNWFFKDIYLDKGVLDAFRKNVAENVKEEWTTPYNAMKVTGMSAVLAVEGREAYRQRVTDFRDTHNGEIPWVHDLLGDYMPEDYYSSRERISATSGDMSEGVFVNFVPPMPSAN